MLDDVEWRIGVTGEVQWLHPVVVLYSADGWGCIHQHTNPLPVDDFILKFIKKCPLDPHHGDAKLQGRNAGLSVCYSNGLAIHE